jgi:hypothetical protein
MKTKYIMAMVLAATIPTTAQAKTILSVGMTEETINDVPYVGTLNGNGYGIKLKREFGKLNASVYHRSIDFDVPFLDEQTVTQLQVGTNLRLNYMDVYGSTGVSIDQDNDKSHIIEGGAFVPLTNNIFTHVNLKYINADDKTIRQTIYLGYKLSTEYIIQAGIGKTTGSDYPMEHVAVTMSYVF